MNLRKLRESDLPDLMALKAAAEWNQTEQDWLLFLRYDPDGCFGIEDNGRVVATSTAMCYGDRMAWIGMVLTLPEYRGRGLGRQLTRAAIEYAGGRIVRLDASDMGRPLYESLGFTAECAIERWCRAPEPTAPPAARIEPVHWDPVKDTEVFGADRSRLLAELARGEAGSCGEAYAFARDSSQGPHFGPCVSDDANTARHLLQWFLHRHGAVSSTCMDLFPHNRSAADVATDCGFRRVRTLTRMVLRPEPPSLPDGRIYATANFAWG